MARAYSQDLRDRVLDAALAGLPARQAAVRFGVGIATAILWVRRARETGERRPRQQGQPRRSKLDPQSSGSQISQFAAATATAVDSKKPSGRFG
jgi:transposase